MRCDPLIEIVEYEKEDLLVGIYNYFPNYPFTIRNIVRKPVSKLTSKLFFFLINYLIQDPCLWPKRNFPLSFINGRGKTCVSVNKIMYLRSKCLLTTYFCWFIGHCFCIILV